MKLVRTIYKIAYYAAYAQHKPQLHDCEQLIVNKMTSQMNRKTENET